MIPKEVTFIKSSELSALWRWPFLRCVLRCTVLLLGNLTRWVCHEISHFCENVAQASRRKHFVVRRDFMAFTRPYSKLGFCLGGTALQWFHLGAHLREVLMKVAVSVASVGQSCSVIWPLMLSSPTADGPDMEGWPTRGTVWTRSCIHCLHTSTGCPHRSAPSATSSSEGWQIHQCKLPPVHVSKWFCVCPTPQVVDHQWQVCSEQPLPLLRQVLPNAALRCRRQQDGGILGLPLCRLWCV